MEYELYDDLYLAELLKEPKKPRPWWHYTLLTIAIGAPICAFVLRMVYR